MKLIQAVVGKCVVRSMISSFSKMSGTWIEFLSCGSAAIRHVRYWKNPVPICLMDMTNSRSQTIGMGDPSGIIMQIITPPFE
jgi:hypothetical protein